MTIPAEELPPLRNGRVLTAREVRTCPQGCRRHVALVARAQAVWRLLAPPGGGIVRADPGEAARR